MEGTGVAVGVAMGRGEREGSAVASGSSLGFTSKVVMELMRQLPSVLSRVKRYLMGVQAGGEAGRPSAAALEVPVMERTSSTTSTDRVPSQGHTRIRLNERV